jgi:hypothetical protein
MSDGDAKAAELNARKAEKKQQIVKSLTDLPKTGGLLLLALVFALGGLGG